MRCDRIWRNARIATLADDRPSSDQIGNGVVASLGGRICFVGQSSDAPSDLDAPDIVDCRGRLITPGLIDCHTHLVYAGNRAHEFEMRLAGVSYEDIARAGGGIVSTMTATRAASEEELIESALLRLDALIAEGVTTLEIKSGYGLALDGERKQLRVARALPDKRNITVRTTFLGAHSVPPEFGGDTNGYMREVRDVMLPQLAAEGLVDAVDAYCERIGFSRDQTDSLFKAARALDLPVKVHAEQFSNMSGALLAAHHGALSADHLEHLDEPGARAMAAAGTVAVLLPGAYYFTRESKLPPIDLLRECKIPMALATDCNPGTSPLTSLLLTMNMGATLFRMTVDECIAGTTREAARALGLWDSAGSIEVGKYCDLAIWNCERPADLVYFIGFNPLHTRIWRGL